MQIKFLDICLSKTIGHIFNINVNPFLKNEELLSFYYYSFWFPKYFGFNWDAFDDCMKDLEWIDADIIQINHGVMTNLSDKMLGFYAKSLNDIIEFHRQSNGKKMSVIFSDSQKKPIMDNYNCTLAEVKM